MHSRTPASAILSLYLSRVTGTVTIQSPWSHNEQSCFERKALGVQASERGQAIASGVSVLFPMTLLCYIYVDTESFGDLRRIFEAHSIV
jgi:hypothetical protein